VARQETKYRMPPSERFKVAYRPSQAPDKSKPYCVYNVDTGDINGRWHATKEQAMAQMKAIYASIGRKNNSEVSMDTPKSYLNPVKNFSDKWIDGNKLWVQQYPFDSWSHPVFSDTTIDVETAQRLKDSFDKSVKGVKLFADYDHGEDKAKGGKAAGEIIELAVVTSPDELRPNPGLWGLVQFNDIAKTEIDNGEWNYWSASHYDTWTHPSTGETHDFVYDGGALTNRPYVKGMAPLNFSEVGITVEQAKNAQPEEFTDPGAPVDPSINEDDSAGDRLDTPPPGEDGSTPDRSTTVTNEGGEMELEKQLREALGLAEDADIIKAVKDLNDEVAPMREALKQHNERKAFSEQFPEEFKELERLKEERRNNEAKRFSEAFANQRLVKQTGDKTEETTLGYSGLVVQKIEEVAKKFNEDNVTLDDFKGVLDAISNNGIVDYGTRGSSREDQSADSDVRVTGTVYQQRKAFADKVTEIMEKDQVDRSVALKLAVERFPVLAEQYRNAGVTR